MQRVELRCWWCLSAKCEGVFLPDANSVFGCEVEFVGGLDVEGGVPAVFVADSESAILAGGVGIGEDFLAKCGVTSDASPVLPEGDEELLVGAQAVDPWC